MKTIKLTLTLTLTHRHLLLSLFSCCFFISFHAQNCDNIGFENGNFDGWKAYTGHCCGAPVDVEGVVLGRHTLIHDSVGDIVTSNQLFTKPPYGAGEYVVRLGNSNIGGEAERLVKTFTVEESTKLFIYQYAVVLEDPGHPAEEQPKFEVRVYDSIGNIVNPPECGFYSVTAGEETDNWHWTSPTVRFRDWTTIGLDLSAYIGDEVSIEFYVQDCAQLGHFGYAYFNATCGFLGITRNWYCPTSQAMILTGPAGFSSYYWPATGDSTRTIVFPDPDIGDSVIVMITNESMCQTQVLHVFSELSYDFPYIETMGDTLACAGEDLRIQLYNPNDLMYYSWYANGEPLEVEGNEVVVNPVENTVYEIVLMSDSVCQFMDTASIQVSVMDAHFFEPFSLQVCPGDSIVMAFPYENADQVQWQYKGVYVDSDTMAIQAIQEDIINVMTSLGACSYWTSIPLTFYPKPAYSLTAADSSLCTGDKASLHLEAVAGYTEINWFMNDLPAGNGPEFEGPVFDNTWYSVELRDTSDCLYSDSLFIQLATIPKLSAGQDTLLCQQKEYLVQAFGDDPTNVYQWSNNESGLQTLVFNSGDYILAVQDSGCYNADTVHVEFIPFVELAQIPNIFTPDNSGVNDEFYYYSQNLADFHIVIINRWGNPVFETTDPHLFWNGFSGGQIVSEDVYFYKLHYSVPCTGESVDKHGNVTVEYISNH